MSTDELPYINIVQEITEACDGGCAHCFGDYGRAGARVATLPDLLAFAAHYPRDVRYHLEITGGEPFTNQAVLLGFLEHLKSHRPQNLDTVTVHTNGKWITDEDSVRRRVMTLQERGVDTLALLSKDKYHEAAGLDRSRLAMAKRVADECLGTPGFVCVGPWLESAAPLGRARRRVPYVEWDFTTKCYVTGIDFVRRTELVVRPNGEAHICPHFVLGVAESIRGHPYEELTERLRASPVYQKVCDHGPSGIMLLLGYDSTGLRTDQVRARCQALGDCAVCLELLLRYGTDLRTHYDCCPEIRG